MKSLAQFIAESLKNLKVYAVDPYNGPVVICNEYPTQDPYSENSEDFNIDDTDWLLADLTNGKGNIVHLEWCDENIFGRVLDVNDERQLRKDFDKNVGKWLEDNKAYINDPGETYVEIYVDLDCGATFDYASERDDFKDFSLDYLWDCWMTQFKDSFVDGDSNYCRCLVDLKKKKVIVGGENSKAVDVQI